MENSKSELSESQKVKEKDVANLVEQIKKSKTLMVVNISGLPSRQFQDIKKTLRGNATVIVAKKNIMFRALDKYGKESILPIKDKLIDNCVLAISNLDGFELAGEFVKNKNPIFAKAGQIATEDIEVKAGPTSLLPGPAISELGSLGIQIAVEDGKISIKESRVVVNKGQEIKEGAASIFQKLDIKPFTIGLEPVAVYDVSSEKIYTDIKIDSEGVIEELSIAAGKALGLAQKIVYYCKDTIGYLLAKANAGGIKLESFGDSKDESGDEKVEEKVEEEKSEDKVEESPTEEGKDEVKDEENSEGEK